MKLSLVLAYASLCVAEASSIYERQVQTIVSVIQQINTDTANLNRAVQAFQGPADVAALQRASDTVAQSVSQGAAQVNQASSISLTDALQLQGQVSTLQTTIEGTVQNLISKKQALVAAGAGGQVSRSLQAQLQGANQLSAAITSKVPQSVQGVATQLSAGISTALTKGVQAFADQAQSVGGGSGAGSVTLPSGSARVSGVSPTTTGGGRVPMFTGAAQPKAAVGMMAGFAGVVAVML